uniref:Trafficking protein particle complex subunit 10 n=1 Tax=Caenorhabditis tropicalis TaxID=1561998 RepID=A0A1I7UE69_9PELO
MDRDSLDLNGLSRSFVKNSVIISHAGVDQSFSVYQHALVSHFSRSPLVWKINNKPFPHRLTLPLKFVPYEEKLCFGPQISATEITKIAFLHVFNINVTSADDYRQNVRHNVSDWFAKLNSKSDIQWIIVINTNRAKDRKTKAAIMEKIKADFGKYTNRLFELPDTSDQTAFVAFVQGIQQFLFTHLTLVMEIWDKSLKHQYEKRKQHTWEPFAYFSSMTEYARVFWSFGAIEYAMSIFDDLEKLLHEFVLRSGEQDSPKWLAQILNTKIEDRPTLIGNFSVQRIQKNEAHYLGMKNYLLCQQIIMSIHLYQQKMKSNDAAPSLRSDCAVGIMQRALITIESVKEFNNLMNNKRDIPMTCCWTWWTVSESFSICQLLCDVSHLNVAPVVLARLHLARFDAIFVLAKQLKLNPEDAIQLSEWLKIKPITLESKVLNGAIESKDQMCIEMEKAHDVCVSSLNHANRHRFVLNITHQLFSFLRSNNAKCPLQKLSVSKSLLKTMPTQESTARMLKSLCSEHLESDSITEEMLSLLFFISQCENGKDSKINEKLIEKCRKKAKEDEKAIEIQSISITEEEMITVKIENFEAIQNTDSILEIRSIIDSKLGFALEKVEVELIFSGDSTGSIAQESNLSVLSLQHERKENICRLVSELKLKSQQTTSNEENSSLKFTISSEIPSLLSGENQISFRTDITKIGCFVLEKVRISTEFIEYSTCNVQTRRPPTLYCIATPHSVTVMNETQHFFAGVLQNLEIDVEAKCDIPRGTPLEIEPSTPNFQFLDEENKWVDSRKMTLEPFKSNEKRRIQVKVWLKIDSSICESAAVQRRSTLSPTFSGIPVRKFYQNHSGVRHRIFHQNTL